MSIIIKAENSTFIEESSTLTLKISIFKSEIPTS